MSAPFRTKLRLGVNLDHVATLRQARRTIYPDLRDAISIAEAAGADGITLHLREDRRHIQDSDMIDARRSVTTSLNMEMAATEEMISIACRIKPDYCCIVPERREELTTEGGLDISSHKQRIGECCHALAACGIRVSLFIEPDERHLETAAELGAPLVELHTGSYSLASDADRQREIERIACAARRGTALGLQVNAGHGLDYGNVGAVAAIPELLELNIGHAIVSRAVFVGLSQAVREMHAAMAMSSEKATGSGR